MKNLNIILLIMFFVMPSIYADNIDFRNISSINSSKTYSQTKAYSKSSFNAKSSQFKYYQSDSKTEAVVKLSVGLLSDISANAKGSYSSYSRLNIAPYTSTSDSGNISKNTNNNNTIFDLGFEMHYFMYEYIGVGGGLSMPLNADITYIDAYLVNPYVSFKIKNFLTNTKQLDNFYLLLNLGTIIPIYTGFSTTNLNLGYDIGVGYEYNNFIFELLYSHYSIKIDSGLNYNYFYYYYNPDNHTTYSYSEILSKADIDISRLKLVVGYKFDM
ncbi:MAG: hypothetical protein WCS83_06125 [Endomicrobiia bacterium]